MAFEAAKRAFEAPEAVVSPASSSCKAANASKVGFTDIASSLVIETSRGLASLLPRRQRDVPRTPARHCTLTLLR